MTTTYTRAALSVAAVLAGSIATAEPFKSVGQFDGRIGASGPDRGPIFAGSSAEISGQGFAPGQPVTLRQSGEDLNGGSPFSADAEGNLSATVEIPDDAEPGLYPVVVELGGESPFATTFDLKVARELGDIGADLFEIRSVPVVRNPYQVAVTADAIYVTGAVGRPPVKESTLVKLDRETLEVLAEATPPEAPSREDGSRGGLFAVYGIGVAEEAGQVWVTNTRQDTVAVYDSADLSLIKQFEPGVVGNSRDAVAHGGKVYVSATFEPRVHVFDTGTLEEIKVIDLESVRHGQTFTAASLSVAPEADKLFVSSFRSEEVAVVDLTTDTQIGGFAVDHSVDTIGLAATPDGKRVYTVAQGNDAVSIIDTMTGETLKQVNVGANPLNAAVEPVSGNVFIALREGDSVAVISSEGEILANLDVGSTPNHLVADGSGGIYVVNKSGGEGDPTADRLSHITQAD